MFLRPNRVGDVVDVRATEPGLERCIRMVCVQQSPKCRAHVDDIRGNSHQHQLKNHNQINDQHNWQRRYPTENTNAGTKDIGMHTSRPLTVLFLRKYGGVRRLRCCQGCRACQSATSVASKK